MVGNNPTQNVFGVSPKAKSIACKNTDGNGRQTIESYIICLDWFLAPYKRVKTEDGTEDRVNSDPSRKPDIIYVGPCLSCGLQPFVLEPIIKDLHEAGILVVVSSGSITNGQNNCNKINSPPANYPQVFTVGGLRKSDNSTLSEGAAGPVSLNGALFRKPDLVADGDGVTGTVFAGNQNLYLIATGTSIAASVVIGGIALLQSALSEFKNQVEATTWLITLTATQQVLSL